MLHIYTVYKICHEQQVEYINDGPLEMWRINNFQFTLSISFYCRVNMSGVGKKNEATNNSKKGNANNDMGEGLNFIYSKAVEHALETYTPPKTPSPPPVEEDLLVYGRRKKKKKRTNDKVIVYKIDEIHKDQKEIKQLLEEAEVKRQERNDLEDASMQDNEDPSSHGNHGNNSHGTQSKHHKHHVNSTNNVRKVSCS